MKTALATIALALALLHLWPHKPLEQCVPVSTTVWSADGEVLRVTLAADDHRLEIVKP
jgi:penicillin-binding protein 1C